MATEEGVKLPDLIAQFEQAKNDEQEAAAKLEAAQRERERLSRLIAAELQLSPTPSPSGGRSRARRSTGTAKASSSDERREAVLAFIRDAAGKGGTNVSEIVAQVPGDMSYGTASRVTNELLESGLVVSEGERRARKLLPA